jgi:DNA (cytosine-5)-methyltransferase 1
MYTPSAIRTADLRGGAVKVFSRRKQRKALSLFSGCGGDTLGLALANVQVTHFVEINALATESHIANFPDSKQLGSDVTLIKDEQFAQLRGKVDLVFGGFPC